MIVTKRERRFRIPEAARDLSIVAPRKTCRAERSSEESEATLTAKPKHPYNHYSAERLKAFDPRVTARPKHPHALPKPSETPKNCRAERSRSIPITTTVARGLEAFDLACHRENRSTLTSGPSLARRKPSSRIACDIRPCPPQPKLEMIISAVKGTEKRDSAPLSPVFHGFCYLNPLTNGFCKEFPANPMIPQRERG
jgi:hypothetical protein